MGIKYDTHTSTEEVATRLKNWEATDAYIQRYLDKDIEMSKHLYENLEMSKHLNENREDLNATSSNQLPTKEDIMHLLSLEQFKELPFGTWILCRYSETEQYKGIKLKDQIAWEDGKFDSIDTIVEQLSDGVCTISMSPQTFYSVEYDYWEEHECAGYFIAKEAAEVCLEDMSYCTDNPFDIIEQELYPIYCDNRMLEMSLHYDTKAGYIVSINLRPYTLRNSLPRKTTTLHNWPNEIILDRQIPVNNWDDTPSKDELSKYYLPICKQLASHLRSLSPADDVNKALHLKAKDLEDKYWDSSKFLTNNLETHHFPDNT